MELADEEFLSIKNETQKLSSEIENSIDRGNLEIEINILSLSSYLENNHKISKIVSEAHSLGFLDQGVDEGDDEYYNFFYGRLLRVIALSSIQSIKDLDLVLTNSNTFEQLKKFKNNFDETGDEIVAIPSDLVTILVAMSDRFNGNKTNLKMAIGWHSMSDTIIKSN